MAGDLPLLGHQRAGDEEVRPERDHRGGAHHQHGDCHRGGCPAAAAGADQREGDGESGRGLHGAGGDQGRPGASLLAGEDAERPGRHQHPDERSLWAPGTAKTSTIGFSP